MDLTLLYYERLDVVTICVAFLLLLPGFLYLMRPKTPLQNRDWTLLRALFLIPLATVIGALLSSSMGPGFAGVRLVYHIGATVYPIIGIVILVISFRRMESSWKKRMSITMGVVCLLLVPLAFWMTFVEPRWMDITTTQIDTNASAKETIRIVVLTDIQTDHFGEWEARIAKETNALKPDLILIPGDLLQAEFADYKSELKKAKHFLSKLKSVHGTFIVQGDADRNFHQYKVDKVELLFNRNQKLNIRGRSILISGLELGYGNEAAKRTIEFAEESDAELNIVFSHRPAAVEIAEKKASNIDLFVAGHTHGGQISIPFFGPPITLSPLPRHIGAGGLHKHSGRQIYVSRGLGLERMNAPRLRLNCRPELALLLVN